MGRAVWTTKPEESFACNKAATLLPPAIFLNRQDCARPQKLPVPSRRPPSSFTRRAQGQPEQGRSRTPPPTQLSGGQDLREPQCTGGRQVRKSGYQPWASCAVGCGCLGQAGRAAPQQKSEQQQRGGLTKAQAQLQAPCGQPAWTEVMQNGRAPPPGQAQPSGPTKAPQTLRDPGQGALRVVRPLLCRRTEQQPPRPGTGWRASRTACTGRGQPPQLSSDEPLPARVGPCSEDPFRAETTFRQTSFGASSQPPTSRPERRLAFCPANSSAAKLQLRFVSCSAECS